MNQYIEVFGQILELLNTLEEGMLHIKSQLTELRYEEANSMLKDIQEGILSIENALKPILPELIDNNIEESTAILKEHITHTLVCYEKSTSLNHETSVEKEMMPIFSKWKGELENVLRPYMAS